MLAVVTGASSGIGAAFSRQLAARGWDLLLVARREDRLRELEKYLTYQHGIRVEVMAADLTDFKCLEAVAARVREAPELGLLVNNAGFGVPNLFYESESADQRRMHRLHVEATVALAHAALASLVLKARNGTGVINVSSVAAFLPAATYGATKTWMNAFTESVSNELISVKSPVTVQALCPGYTLTEFHDAVGQDRTAIPSWMWMPPDAVVAESLRGFDRGKLIVVPGWRYRWGIRLLGILPRAVRRRMLIAAVPRYRRMKKGTAG